MAAGNPDWQSGRRTTCAAATLLCLGALMLRGAEAVIDKEFLPERPAKPAVLPKVKPQPEEASTFRNLLPSGGPESPVPFSVPTIILRRPLSRAEAEKADQRKNWIFVTPATTDQSLEQALGIRREKLENEDQPFKGVLERYLETAAGPAAVSADKTRTNSAASLRERDPHDPIDRGDPLLRRNERRAAAPRDAERAGPNDSSLTKTSLVGVVGLPAALLRMPGDYSNGSSAIADLNYSSLYNTGSDYHERRARAEERKARAAEFRAILEGRALVARPAPAPGGTMDPINLLQDSTTQPVNPVMGNSLEAFGKGGGPGASGPGAATSAALPNAFGNPAARPLGNSALSPSAIAPVPVSAIVQPPQPAVLEMPRRKL